MLPVRNGRVCQVAAHMAVSLTKAAHRVLSVADADVQAGTQPKIVAHVVPRGALIALLKGVERHDGRVRQRLCGDTRVGSGAGGTLIPCTRYMPLGGRYVHGSVTPLRVEGRLCGAWGFDGGCAAPLCLWLRTQHARKSQANAAGDVR